MYKRIAAILVCAASVVLFFLNPAKNIQNVSAGVLIWATSVLPALFPFFFLSKLLIELDAFGGLSTLLSKPTQKIFGAPPAASYIFLLSVVCGYPMGAKLTAEFYEKGALDKTQCLKLATFCSTGGPIFIIGTVGGVYLKSAAAGAIILVSHILGALANGLLYRRRFVSVSECGRLISQQKNNGEILGDCMQNSIISVLSVGGFVTVFYMWTQMLLSLPPLSGAGKLVQGIAGGLLEVTAGCKILADTGSAPLTVVLCCFLISLGGLCIFLQSSVFYRKCGVGSGKIMLFKLTQAIFSAAFCTPLAFLFLK